MAERMLAANGVTGIASKAVARLAGSVQSSLRNHKGGIVRQVGTGMPARWAVAV